MRQKQKDDLDNLRVDILKKHVRDIKFRILTELKKYSKTGCLVLALGGASVVGMAQPYVGVPINLVQHFLQGDGQWKNILCGNSETETIGNIGCALVSATMVICANGVYVEPDAMNTHMKRNGGFSGGSISDWSVPTKYPLVTATWDNKYNFSNDFSALRDILKAKNPIILKVKGKTKDHFVMIYGYTGNGDKAADFLIADPGDPTFPKNMSDFALTRPEPILYVYRNVYNSASIPLLGNAVNNPVAPSINISQNEYQVGEQINFSVNGFTSTNVATDSIQVTVLMLNGIPDTINPSYERNTSCYVGEPWWSNDVSGGYYIGADNVHWENRWAKIIAHNTKSGLWGQAVYVHIKPNNEVPVINPSLVNGSEFNHSTPIEVFVNEFNPPYTDKNCSDPGWNCSNCVITAWEKWDKNVKVHIACLLDTPLYTNNSELLYLDERFVATHTSVKNKYSFQVPQRWARNDGKPRWVKIIVEKVNGGQGQWSSPRYIKISPINANERPITNEPDGAITTQSFEGPSISTTPSQYTNCYREGSSVHIKVSDIDVSDVVELHYSQLVYEKRNVDCSYSHPDCIHKFTTPIPYTAPSTVIALTNWNWAGTTLKVKAYNKTKGKWSNDIYIDVRKKDDKGVSYLTQCDYKEAFDENDGNFNFNWRFAYWCGKVAEASYLSGNNKAMEDMGFTIINSNFFTSVYNLINSIKYDIGEKTINGQKYIMISIRGTDPNNWYNFANNLFTDISANPKRWEDGKPTQGWIPDMFDKRPEVHGGFYDVYKGIWDNSIENIWKQNKNARYIVTGHSLGGAVAELISLKLADKAVPPENIICYGFASPPVGDLDLFNHAGQKGVRSRIHKLVNCGDLIPHAGVSAYTLANSPVDFFSNCSSSFTSSCPFNPFNWHLDCHNMSNVYLEKLETEALKTE